MSIIAPKAPGAPSLVIIGRPNVGKSTLFNRLFGRKRSLVHDEPGVTRDRIEEEATWMVDGENWRMRLIDTGGLGGDKFSDEISHQVQTALRSAQVVLALFDGQSGYTPHDREVVQEIIRSGLGKRDIPILGVVNKVDEHMHEVYINEFFETGLDPIVTISAEHGRGIEDLKTLVVSILRERGGIEAQPMEEEKEDRIPRVAIVGRPNVGKSTMVNALLREDRMITSPMAGTTVDAVDSLCRLGGKPYVLIDTAGIRRKAKTEQGIEVLSVIQARKALERCDVAILLLDGEHGVTEQDEKIGGLIEEVGCGVILVLNKWDTQKRNTEFTKEDAAERVLKQMAYLRYAPIMFTSAKEGTGFRDLGDLVSDILEQRKVKLSTKEFTEFVREESRVHNPGNVKFFMCHQSGRHPPTFVCHVSQPDRVHFSLKRHLINAIRERWGYRGNPIRLHFVKRSGT